MSPLNPTPNNRATSLSHQNSATNQSARPGWNIDPGRLLRTTISNIQQIIDHPRTETPPGTATNETQTGTDTGAHTNTPTHSPTYPGADHPETVDTNQNEPQQTSNQPPTTVIISTHSGNGTAGYADGTGGPHGTTQFNGPYGICVDQTGNIFVADTHNHRIRKIAPDGTTTTLTGNGTAGYHDGSGGPQGTTQFNYPYGVAVDTQNNIYVADASNHRIRKISSEGVTTTLAGNGTPGFHDGTGGAAGSTQFESPFDVTVDQDGCVYVAETYANRIRKITPDGTTTTLAGNGNPGYVDGTGGANGTTQFNAPYAVDVSTNGVVYVADNLNNRIRKISSDGTTTTHTGNGTPGFNNGTGGPNGTTQFHNPTGICIATNGTIYVADSLNDSIRTITPNGTTTTLAGNQTHGHTDGTGGPNGTAEFSLPFRVAVRKPLGAEETIYVADSDNNTIRKISYRTKSQNTK
jgi:NHL repeat